MQNTSEVFAQLRTAQSSLESIRNDLSTALVAHRATPGGGGTEAARLHDLHRRVSAALSALCGEVRER